MNNKGIGDQGEKEVVKLVKCPNCGKKLMLLPTNYPLYDVQCSACQFRAQVKTNNCEPKSDIRGAGWNIMEKVLKSGFLSPPLIANFKWKENSKCKQKIYFFPFISKNNLTKYKIKEGSKRAGYRMFVYNHLLELPYFVLYEK